MADPTASDIFVPTDGDYAVGILQRIFGESVTSLLGEDSTTTGTAILVKVIGTFNVAVLFFATVVAAYLMYQMFLDTARDGEAGGRETNLAGTTIRAAAGAAFLLPVKSGFSVVQILVLQLLLWGSGLGDYVWSTVAENLQTSATYTASTSDTGDSFVTAKKLSGVLATRTAGYLCMLHANNISKTLQTGNTPLSSKSADVMRNGGDTTAIMWYFDDGSTKAYAGKKMMCGSVMMSFSGVPVADSDIASSMYGSINDDGESNGKSYGESLADLTNNAVKTNGITAVATIDAAAQEIANEIYAGKRETTAIKQKIKSTVDSATSVFISGVRSSVNGNSNAEQLKQSFLSATTDNGWMWAATWQRALATYVTKLNNARNELQFTNSLEMDPKAASDSWGIFGYSDTEKRLFASVDRDFDYLKTFNGSFANAGNPNPKGSETTLEQVTANNEEESWGPVLWVYGHLFSWASGTEDGQAKSSEWSDPLVQVQDQGNTIMIAGSLTIAAAAAAETIGEVAAGLTFVSGQWYATAGAAAASYAAAIMGYFGWGLLVLGIILAIMLPFLPFVYFLSGAIGWVIMSIEAMVAAPLWILLTFAPHRSGDIIGTNKQGLLLMIGVFFRPVLMIIGLMACFIVLRIGLDFINIMFYGIYMIMSPDSSFSNVFMAFGLIGMYVLTLITLVTNCSSLITGVSDAVMEFIGVRVGILGSNNIADSVQQNLNPVGRAAGNMEGSILGMKDATRRLSQRGGDNKKKLSDGISNFKNRGSNGGSSA